LAETHFSSTKLTSLLFPRKKKTPKTQKPPLLAIDIRCLARDVSGEIFLIQKTGFESLH
jgi:hypothetical protein